MADEPPTISDQYQSPEGTIIRLVCPWPAHSGRIPPPTITFETERGPIVFIYIGSADD